MAQNSVDPVFEQCPLLFQLFHVYIGSGLAIFFQAPDLAVQLVVMVHQLGKLGIILAEILDGLLMVLELVKNIVYLTKHDSQSCHLWVSEK